MRVVPRLSTVIDSPISQSKSWAGSWTGPEPLIDVSQAAPGYPPARELRDHLAKLVLEADSSTYTEQTGIVELRESYAASVGEFYGTTISPDQIAITGGCNQAFCVAALCLAEAGDEIILPVPYYFNHDMWLRALGIRPIYARCNARLEPEVDHVRQLIGARTRALVLVTPNNPTGAIYSRGLLSECYELCADRGIALIVDETYRDFQSSHPPRHDLLSRPGWEQTLIQLYSFSKAYALAGYRVGAITAGPSLLQQIAKALDCVTICPAHVSQHAALFGLNNLDQWKRDKASLISHRMDLFVKEMTAAETGFEIASSGAYFAYLRHPWTEMGATEAARRLVADLGVLSIPGDHFGPGQESFLRLAFANLAEDGIRDLVSRLCA